MVAVEDHKVLKIAAEQHWRPVISKGSGSLESVKERHDAR